MRLLTFTCLLLTLPQLAQTGEPDPLFRSDEILKVTIRAPIVRIMESRNDGEDMPGLFVYTNAGGEQQQLSVKIRARGNFRRSIDVCRFAPLRLNFVKSETSGTLFDEQDKLKLVTHCETRSRNHERSLLREYLAYRVLNLLTDVSFRVRLLQITYEDTEARRRPYTEFGFLIEHKDGLARRIDAQPIDTGGITVSALEPEHLTVTSLFQFFIANTDFSPIAASKSDTCCHNHELFQVNREAYYSVPYDFDMSGFVAAGYAKPNPRFGIRTVMTRLYRGRCSTNEFLPETLDLFRERRAAIGTLVDDFPHLDKRSKRNLAKFIGHFYRIIDDPEDLQRRIYDDCL